MKRISLKIIFGIFLLSVLTQYNCAASETPPSFEDYFGFKTNQASRISNVKSREFQKYLNDSVVLGSKEVKEKLRDFSTKFYKKCNIANDHSCPEINFALAVEKEIKNNFSKFDKRGSSEIKVYGLFLIKYISFYEAVSLYSDKYCKTNFSSCVKMSKDLIRAGEVMKELEIFID